MRKLSLVLLAMAIGTAFAVDMRGKVGLGAGWTVPGADGSTPSYAVTKIGLGEKLVLEPTLQFTYSSVSDGGTDNTYSFDISALFGYAFMAHERTNIYAKGGVGFGSSKPSLSSSTTATTISVPFGFGLEYFVSSHFSVDLNAAMGISFTAVTVDGPGDYNKLDVGIGNGSVRGGLVWYY